MSEALRKVNQLEKELARQQKQKIIAQGERDAAVSRLQIINAEIDRIRALLQTAKAELKAEL